MGLSLEGFGEEFEIGKLFGLWGGILFGGRTHWSSTYWSLEREEEQERTSKKEDFYLGIVFRRKRKDSQKPSHCNQSCPGMHLVAFGILTYV